MLIDECESVFGNLRILPVNVVEDFDFLFARTFGGGLTGNSLVKSIERVASETKGMTADQLEHYGNMEFLKLQKAHGPQLEARLQLVGKMVAEIEAKKPGVIALPPIERCRRQCHRRQYADRRRGPLLREAWRKVK